MTKPLVMELDRFLETIDEAGARAAGPSHYPSNPEGSSFTPAWSYGQDLSGKVAILFNGPPRSGKDTAANALMTVLCDAAEILKFTTPIKEITHAAYGLDVPVDFYDDKLVKDTPRPEFDGLSPRQAYIKKSDEIKAVHGPEAIADLYITKLAANTSQIVLTPDVGDDMEAGKVADLLGAERVLVFRVHRAGKDFSNDCRTWVRNERFDIVDVWNREEDLPQLEAEVVATSLAFLGRHLREKRLLAVG